MLQSPSLHRIYRDLRYQTYHPLRQKHFAYYWEFPGGKVDHDENLEYALKREINEELSINIKINKKITSQKHKDEKINVEVHYFLCETFNTNIILSEHEDMKWVYKQDLIHYKLVY